MRNKTRSVVILQAFSTHGRSVLEERLPLSDFYEKSHSVLDDAEFRKATEIVRVTGIIYDAAGAIAHEFAMRFDASGVCVCEAARAADGPTVGAGQELIAAESDQTPSAKQP